MEYQREEAKKQFEINLEKALREQDERQNKDIETLKQRIEDEKLVGVNLQGDIESLNGTIEKKREDLKFILTAFQKFVDQTPGFTPGQSEFLLNNLVPAGFEEFISSD